MGEPVSATVAAAVAEDLFLEEVAGHVLETVVFGGGEAVAGSAVAGASAAAAGAAAAEVGGTTAAEILAAETSGAVGGAAAVEAGASAAATNYALVRAGGFALQAGTSLLTSFASSFVLGGLFARNAGGRPSASDQLSKTAQGALINSVSNVDPIPVLYGSRRVGGTRVLTEVTGASNEYLHLLIVWGEGPIAAVNTVYLDGVSAADSRFSGLVYREDYLGSDSQAASAYLIAEIANAAKWNASCTLSGIAYTYLRVKWDRTAFPGGLPNVTADISGRTLYDQRDGSTAFSHNPWLVIRDYLTNSRYGRGIDSSMIDDTTFSTEANYADVAVSIPGGGTQARFTCDGVVNVDDKPMDNLRSLLSSCRGFLVFSGGKYRARTERLESPVSFELTEDNTVGAWSFSTADKRSKFNRVKARFFNPNANWQPDITFQESAAYRLQDANLTLETQLELPFTTDLYRAQQLAQTALKRSRFGIQAQLTATIAATQLEVGNVVRVTNTTPGWVQEAFRVTELELQANDEVRVSLIEYDDTAYDLDALTAVSSKPTTNLPDPSSVAPPGAPAVVESQYVTANPAGVKTKATVTWGASPSIYVQSGGSYQVEVLPPGAATWLPVATTIGTMTKVDVMDLEPGVWGFRIKALNSLGVASTYATTTQEIFGLNIAPSDIAGFTVQSYTGVAKFTWTKVGTATASDLAVNLQGRVIVRWAPARSGAIWADGVRVNPDGYPGDTSIGFGDLQTGTYMAKAWNGLTYSANAASFVATEALLTGLTTLASITESPAFAGNKTNTVVVGSALQLESGTLVDSILTNVDAWDYIDSLGGLAAAGNYAFSQKLDLGSATPARLYANIASNAFDTGDFVDSWTDLIDDHGDIDGTPVEDAEVTLFVRTTNDNPASNVASWSAFHPMGMTADYANRGFDFELRFTSGQVTHNRAVTGLTVTAKQ